MPNRPRKTYKSRRQEEQARPSPMTGRPKRTDNRPSAQNQAKTGTRPTATSGTKPKPKPAGPAKAGGRAAPATGDKPGRAGKPSSQPANRSRRPDAKSPQAKPPRTNAQSRTAPRSRPSGPSVTEPMRIAKAMARAGLCSRRDAERWIAEGRVRINGRILDTAARDVGPKDRIEVDGEPLPMAEPPRLWRFHKQKGTVTSARDPQGRPTVFDALPEDMPRVISIGRLDYNTEGLLLLTNDGELARHLELPSTGWLRRYRVRARGRVSEADLAKLKDGITIDGIHYGPVEASVDSVAGANTWLTMGLREGKNREVRRILAHLDLEVNRLIRVSYGPFQLHDLPPGEVEHVRRKVLIDQLGHKVAAGFGLRAGGEEDDASPAPRPPRTGPPRRRPPKKAG